LDEYNVPIENYENLVSSGLNLSGDTAVYKIVKKDGKIEEKQ